MRRCERIHSDTAALLSAASLPGRSSWRSSGSKRAAVSVLRKVLLPMLPRRWLPVIRLRNVALHSTPARLEVAPACPA